MDGLIPDFSAKVISPLMVSWKIYSTRVTISGNHRVASVMNL